jgi:hypothetical protein
MDLRIPAPSSDDVASTPKRGTRGTLNSPTASKRPGGVAEAHRGEGPTISSVSPVYMKTTTSAASESSSDPASPSGAQAATPGSDPPARTVVVETPSPDLPPAPAAPANGPAAPASAATEPDRAGTAAEPSASSTSARAAARIPKLRPRRRQRVRLRHLLPAWCVSLLVHVVILTALAAATFSSQDRAPKRINFNSALAGYREGVEEQLNVWAEPADLPRDQAVGNEHGGAGGGPVLEMDSGGGEDDGDGAGMVVAATFGGAGPSATPRFRGAGKGKVNERNSLPSFKIEGLGGSPLSTLPVAPAADLYGGGKIAGDPVFDVQGIGPALDQLAREILRHLKDHKVTVVWLLDESISMEDDHRTMLEKFDRVSSELKKNIEPGDKTAGALNHAIVGFGQGIEYVLKKPTLEIDEIGKAMRKLKTDISGVENTMRAIHDTVEAFAGIIGKNRKMLLVLMTDESGDDGADVEEARQVLMKYKVPLYVIGRQSLFGYQFAHHRFEDPVTKDVYHPLIRRGPETADVEIYQWDGLFDRWDEQPSGFAPWELARLTSASGGIYFLLPSEEFLRTRKREQLYSLAQLKEFMPEYDNRLTYFQHRTESELRRSLYQIITQTKSFVYRRNFPIDTNAQMQAAIEEGTKATEKLNALIGIQEHLENLHVHRDREPLSRWKAHYDLVLAQTVAFQIKAYEYRALMADIAQKPRAPKKMPTPDLVVDFVVDHSKTPLAPKEQTGKKYVEATKLLKSVIERYPRTPWADLAQDTLDRGFSVQLNEWHHSPNYNERAQYVPKY